MSWSLPKETLIDGVSYQINSDYRDILQIIEVLTDEDEIQPIKAHVALSLFYEQYSEIPQERRQEAADFLISFINCGEDESSRQPTKLFDWQQDKLLIVADINRAAGCEVRAVEYMHWWTFIAYFSGIGEGRLSTVVSIRDKLHKGKSLEKWERDYYSENKEQIDFKKKYSAEEIAEQDRLKALLGEVD